MSTTQAESPCAQPIVGVSNWAREIHAEIESTAPFPSNVLICGPTGTGKELVAQAIHRRSPRAGGPFVAVNCAAVAPSLFESQLFGHVRGSFTGADSDATGYFRAADGGTLFLDEIGELDLALQAKLLRVLQEGAVTPVGGHGAIPVDVRIVAATNRELIDEAAAGRFREDLFYRLAVAVLRTVPLADRPEDIHLISQFLISKLCHGARMPFKPLSSEAEARLIGHGWPGNVRELQNVLERALMRAKGPLVRAEDVVLDRGPATPSPRNDSAAAADEPSDTGLALRQAMRAGGGWPTMKQFERYVLEMTLARTEFNQTEAARVLEMTRGSLYRRLKEHRIDSKRPRDARRNRETSVAVAGA